MKQVPSKISQIRVTTSILYSLSFFFFFFFFFAALEWLRGTKQVHSELELIRSEFEAQKSASRVTLGQMLTNPMLRIPLIISIVIMLAQQLSGINAVSFFFD